MTGFNLFNATTSAATEFTTPSLNTTATFGTTNNQQNLSFGASATPSFRTSTNTFGFGNLKSQLGTPGSNLFGGTNQIATQSGLTFGTSTAVSSTPQGSNTGMIKPTFGAAVFGSASNTQSGLSFGTAGSTNTSQTGLGETLPATLQPSQSGISFGTPTTSTGTSTGLAFGSTPPAGISFGSSTTAQPSMSFGAATTSSVTDTTEPSFVAAPTATTATPGLGFPFGTTSSDQTAQPTLSFGASFVTTTASLTPQTTTNATPPMFGGIPSATTATTSASSLFGPSSTTSVPITSSGVIFSWQKTTADTVSTSTASAGLGGIFHSAVTTTQSSPNNVLSVKEQPLPNEIRQTVTAFKEHVKLQKNLSSEVARSSAEPLGKSSQQIEALNNLIINLGSVLSQQKFSAEKIKSETIKSLNDYELVQKIKDSPVASEERMLAIRKYFTEKISAFEESTKILQEKIEYVYQHVITLPQENSLSAEALKLIVKKLHDSFVVIGARTYQMHNDMQLLKVQYLTLRNQFVKDSSSVSFSLNKELQLPSLMRSKTDLALEGPNPFSRSGNGSLNSLLLTSQNRSFSGSTTAPLGGGSLSSSKPFGFSDISSTSLFDQSNLNNSQQINLQKPPIGNKRGKR